MSVTRLHTQNTPQTQAFAPSPKQAPQEVKGMPRECSGGTGAAALEDDGGGAVAEPRHRRRRRRRADYVRARRPGKTANEAIKTTMPLPSSDKV